MDVPRDRIDMSPLEWKPERTNGRLLPEEHTALKTLVSKFYHEMSQANLPETPEFSIWFGENQITISGNLPELDPESVRVLLGGQSLLVRGAFRKLTGAAHPPRLFQKIFMLPYPIDPKTLRTNWMMNFLVIQAQRLKHNDARAA